MADQIPYERAILAPPVPVRTEFTTTGTLEASSQVDFAVCDFDANKTLDFLPKDWPDGSILTVVLKDVDYTVTFEDYAGADKDTKNIEIPDGIGIPTLSEVAHSVTLRWDEDDLLWRLIQVNFDPHILHDRTNNTVGYGGAADATNKHKFHGDVLIEDDTGDEALCTIKNTGVASTDSAVLSLEGTSAAIIFHDSDGDADEKLFHIGHNKNPSSGLGQFSMAVYTDAGVLVSIPFAVRTNGHLVTSGMPTSDPVVAGVLWNDSGTVKVSAG